MQKWWLCGWQLIVFMTMFSWWQLIRIESVGYWSKVLIGTLSKSTNWLNLVDHLPLFPDQFKFSRGLVQNAWSTSKPMETERVYDIVLHYKITIGWAIKNAKKTIFALSNLQLRYWNTYSGLLEMSYCCKLAFQHTREQTLSLMSVIIKISWYIIKYFI